MNDAQVGALFRAVRMRRGLRQLDVGRSSRTSQQLISLLELGHLEEVGLAASRRVASTLGIQLRFDPWYRGADAYRLLDAAHARVAEGVVRRLGPMGWASEAEFTFNRFGDRGAVDVLASRDHGASVAIIEVKTRLVDVQDTLSALDRKVRVVPDVLRRQRGWRPTNIARILVLPDETANRAAVLRHEASFRSVMPGSSRQVLAWLRDPRGPVAGIWFLSVTSTGGGKRIPQAPRRVRRHG